MVKNRRLAYLLILLVLFIAIYSFAKKVQTMPSTFSDKPITSSSNNKSTGSADSNKNISEGEIPSIPFEIDSDYVIRMFANNLGNPRDLVFSPDGTLLVSTPASNKVYALMDKDKNGVADSNKVVINKGNHIHGLTFYNNMLFVAEVDKVVRYIWDENAQEAKFDKELFKLPANNNHNNRTIVFDKSGNMYVSVGSTCNVCKESSLLSATILVSDIDGKNMHVFARGLRNAPFMVLNSNSGMLWATEMGRDNLGDDIPPDEINIIEEGKHYGWPICYGNRIHDTSFDKNVYVMDPCKQTVSPLFEIPAHSAPLGLTFINSPQFSDDWQNDLLVSYHGSWNKSVPDGYKIVHMKVENNKILSAKDFITGFIQKGNVLGRPVDLVFDSLGNLYISDDKAGNIYIVQKK